jgi:hypothetical protein
MYMCHFNTLQIEEETLMCKLYEQCAYGLLPKVHSLPTTKNDMDGYMVQWLAGSNA